MVTAPKHDPTALKQQAPSTSYTDEFWVGTSGGLVHHTAQGSFNVFSGARWLPTVNGSAAVSSVVSGPAISPYHRMLHVIGLQRTDITSV
jgi:hypothetical protein